jgi:hypothetical protein
MSDSGAHEAEDALQATRWGAARRLKGRLGRGSRWLRHTDRAVLGIGVILSGVLAVAGVAHLAWPWLFVMGCAVTAVATFTTRALEASKDKDKVRNLWPALGVASLMPIAAFLYHDLWDPSRARPSNHPVIIKGGGDQVLFPYDEPGGSQGHVYNALLTGGSITLECYVSLPGGVIWYRVQGNGGWLPHNAVRATPGVSFPKPPHC